MSMEEKEIVLSKKGSKTKKVKKVYEISAFFHAIIVLMVVILYAELTFLAVIYFNYDVHIESKSLIECQVPKIKKPKPQDGIVVQEVEKIEVEEVTEAE